MLSKAAPKNRRAIKRIFLAVVLMMTLFSPVICTAEENTSILDDLLAPQLKSEELRKLQDNLNKSMPDEARELFPYYSPKQLMEELVTGKARDEIQTIPRNLLNFILNELKVNFALLLKIIIVVFLSALIKNLQGSFKESTVGELAYFACYAAIITMVALGFQSVLQYAKEVLDTVDNITGFAIPAMLALLISSGSIVSGSALQPVLLVAIQATVKVFRTVFLPLCFLSGILYLANGLSSKIKISGMAALLRQIVGWGLAGILTLYASFVAIQGVTGAVIDGAATKTAKVAMNTLIPVAGKYMADATDTIINCALIIKNTAGVATMIVTVAACLTPILKMFVIILLYRFAAALIEPVAEDRMFRCLTDVSGCMKTMLGVVGAAVFMFLLSMGILLGAGGISGMIQ